MDRGIEKPGIANRLLTGFAVLLLLLGFGVALTINFTMPNTPLMLVRIGAAELSLWVLSIILVGLALLAASALRRGRRRSKLSVPAAILGIAGAILAGVPVAQIPSTASRAEDAMRAGLGTDYASHIPVAMLATMHPAAFSPGDYFGGIDVGGMRVTRGIAYRTVGTHTLLLDRYSPLGPGPHPGLLIIHGGSWRNGDKGEYPQASIYFANRGYVVYDIQYRLSGEAQYPAQIEDVECALGFMRQHAGADGLDPESVVTFGRSAGAHLALLAAYRANRNDEKLPADCARPATVRATVAYYPPTDLADDYAHPAEPDLIDTHSVLGAFMGGTPATVPANYAAATPQHWLDRPVPPTLLVQGGADQIVLPHNSTDLAALLRQKGDKVVVVTLPWAGHGFDAIFSGPASQIGLYCWERFMAYALSAQQ